MTEIKILVNYRKEPKEMQIKLILKKITLTFFVLCFLFFPLLPIWAKSDLSQVWARSADSGQSLNYFSSDVVQWRGVAILLIYFMVAAIGMMAVSMIFVGYIKMFLASGNDDNHDSAHHSFVSGIVSLIVSVVVFAFLGQIIGMFEQLASKLV